MAKYTDKQLKEMAEEVLCAYNLNDMRADMLINAISSIMRVPVQRVFSELHNLSNKEV